MKNDWEKIRKIKHGHGYWKRLSDGAIGIADDSGSYPENCEPADRPPLLLDRGRFIAMDGQHHMIPVKHDDGSESWTPASGFEALWVATSFEMNIVARETLAGEELTVKVARR